MMKRLIFAVTFTLMGAFPAGTLKASPFIVENGKPNAEIVISEDDQRPRMAALAALELQYYVQEISNARLPIVTQTGDMPVKIYVGRSEHTDRLGVTADDLKYGAFRLESGDDWLVLLGQDVDFTPPDPWPPTRGAKAVCVEAWDKLTAEHTDAKWGYPFSSTFKMYWNPRNYGDFMADRYGADNKHVYNPRDLNWSRNYQGPGSGAGYWLADRGGSLNAVCEYLRTLGVRWYMPGDLGTVVPQRANVKLAGLNKTLRPDYLVRYWFWYNYAGFSFEDTVWARRLGVSSLQEVFGGNIAHGHTRVHARQEMQEKHPEYYALIGGRRDTTFRGTGRACYSSEGLLKETVNYARFMFDHYDHPHVSLWPQDGFLKCECEECSEKSASDVVWGFVERAARELYKTHPDRLVSCGAYTSYGAPPESIDSFSPNVVVLIANCGRPKFDDPVVWNSYWNKIEGWREKVAPGNLFRTENNRFGLTRTFPVIHPHAMAKDLKALKGVSMGEACELAQRGMKWHSPGFDHLTLYVQTRLWWDADRDVDALLDEYYEKFYGPAGAGMKKAFEFAEASYVRDRANPRDVGLETRIAFVKMLQSAREEAGNTVYGKRIQILLDEMAPLEKLQKDLEERVKAGNPRDNNPVAVAADLGRDQKPQGYSLRGIKDGAEPEIKTTFTVAWEEDTLIFNIRCEEPSMDDLFITQNVWAGDSVALLLETPSHSYYQIEVNPNGKIFDADRYSGVLNRTWNSLAQVSTEKGKDYWTAEIRVPVVSYEEGSGDPNHYVLGSKPSEEHPWFFNVGRARYRDEGSKAYTFSPTGGNYHVLSAFSKLIIK